MLLHFKHKNIKMACYKLVLNDFINASMSQRIKPMLDCRHAHKSSAGTHINPAMYSAKALYDIFNQG